MGLGKDFTLFALVDGKVHYVRGKGDRIRCFIEPVPAAAQS